MHSGEYVDPEDGSEVFIHHNGSFSGEVLINVPADKTKVQTFDLGQGDSSKRVEVSIHFSILKSLVAEYVRSEKISQLENPQNGDDEILGVKKK